MSGARRRRQRLLCVLGALGVCLITSPTSAFSQRIWVEVPFIAQEEKACGAASASMLLEYWSEKGAPVTPERADQIFARLYSENEKGIRPQADPA